MPEDIDQRVTHLEKWRDDFEERQATIQARLDEDIKELKEYMLDGVQVGTNTNSMIIAPTGNSYLATDYLSNTDRYFGGILSNCAIYNTALSASRILAHYNAGIA